MSNKPLCLIDGDILCYRSAFAAEKTKYTIKLDSGESHEFMKASEMKAFLKEYDITEYELHREKVIEPLSHALQNVKSQISKILGFVEPRGYMIFLSKGHTFRDDLATIKKYKGNRDASPRPKYYNEVRDYMVRYYGAEMCEEIEADDALANHQDDNSVICSIDKDLLQIPGKHYNWVREEAWLVSPEAGLRSLYTQVLMGDTTDNIFGLPKIGPVTAKKFLKDSTTEEELRAVCDEKYDTYFRESEDDWFQWDEKTSGIIYKDWNGTESNLSPVQVVDELVGLLRVGSR